MGGFFQPAAPTFSDPEPVKEEPRKDTKVDPNRDEQMAAARKRRQQLASRKGRDKLKTQDDKRVSGTSIIKEAVNRTHG